MSGGSTMPPREGAANGYTARHAVCMVSDFFFPNMGGVESHMYQLSQCLMRKGHKMVVVTHAYDDRVGVRYLTNGLKVYYIPGQEVYQKATLPTIYTTFPLLRYIFIREGITIVHGHAAFSTLAIEAILHARTMGISAVFTDHSLCGFSDVSSILVNKVLEFALADISHVICVSHTTKENTVLRGSVQPNIVSVIPNAVDTAQFTPDYKRPRPPPGRVTVVVLSRLVYRKGVDLLAEVIPRACAAHPGIDFIIGGDGPKRVLLEEVRERHQLHDRITFLGPLAHDAVRDVCDKDMVLVQGDIFLNTSLTEAFCIAIIEAASCGLLVVTTDVGGIPEVLPDGLVHLARPTPDGLVQGLNEAIAQLPHVDKRQFHQRITECYNWFDVADRTEKVYDHVCRLPPVSLLQQIQKFYSCGPFAGPIFVIIVVVNYLFYCFLEVWVPRKGIDIARNFPVNVSDAESSVSRKQGSTSNEE